MANIVVAYICWLFGGALGLHHFYLGRDKQALVWFMSFGGLILGWVRDVLWLPEYVYESNQDIRFINEFRTRRQFRPKPPFSITRFSGQLFIGVLLCYLSRLFISERYLDSQPPALYMVFTIILPVIGSTIGVGLVANISHRKVAWKWCLLGSLLGVPFLLMDQPLLHMCPFIASCLAAWKTEWDPDWKPQKGGCNCVQRALVFSLCAMVYVSMWGSGIIFNCHITTSDGLQVPISEAVRNYFTSPAWKEFKKTMGTLYTICQTNGWDHCYRILIQTLDPLGESHAYKVLEFEGQNPTPKEISSKCRQLSRKWHPDQFKTESEKADAQEKFIEIQKACEVLNQLKKRRAEKNMKSDMSNEQGTKSKSKQPGKKGRPHKNTEL